MGYHNHSAVSKGLKRVRDMAARFFDENSPQPSLAASQTRIIEDVRYCKRR